MEYLIMHTPSLPGLAALVALNSDLKWFTELRLNFSK